MSGGGPRSTNMDMKHSCVRDGAHSHRYYSGCKHGRRMSSHNSFVILYVTDETRSACSYQFKNQDTHRVAAQRSAAFTDREIQRVPTPSLPTSARATLCYIKGRSGMHLARAPVVMRRECRVRVRLAGPTQRRECSTRGSARWRGKRTRHARASQNKER